MPDLDVIVIGGGPSGATAAALLAERGFSVRVLERERFPRFHIGESLLPNDVALFERLGLSLDGAKEHVLKRGAEFYDEAAGRYAEYPFSDSLGGTAAYSFHVDRATFDAAVLARAGELGADVREGVPAAEARLGADAVEIVDGDGEVHRARYAIDATGLDGLLARQHRTKRRIEEFALAAVYRHFHLSAPAAEEVTRRGNVKVFFVDEGWLWAIPLGGGRLSVGLVTRKRGIADGWLDDEIAASPELSRLLADAEPEGAHRRIGSFSSYNARPHGPRWVCVGDAACFLDPVFSSGVSFAMHGAADVVDALAPALEAGTEGAPGLMDAHAAHMTHGYNVFGTLIQALYRRRVVPDLFFTSEQDAELRKGLTTVLAGDVWRADNRFQEKLSGSERRRFAIPLHQEGQSAAE